VRDAPADYDVVQRASGVTKITFHHAETPSLHSFIGE